MATSSLIESGWKQDGNLSIWRLFLKSKQPSLAVNPGAEAEATVSGPGASVEATVCFA